MIVTMFINYETFIKASPVFYGVVFVLLVAVLFTAPINGASRWFTFGTITFQPTELAKVAVILMLAFVIPKIQKYSKKDINKPTRLLLVLAVVAVPVGLIVLQPDIGTAMVFCVLLAMVLFTSGIYKRYIIAVIVIVVVSAPLIYQFALPPHAKQRIDIFLNPESDPRGAGYNIIQSKLAVGSGGLTGMGLFRGNQTQLGFLHPKTTDFIFAVISEEMGFIVSGAVVILFVYFTNKALYVAKTAKNDTGAIVAAGIAGIFLFHTMQNIGMVMGLLPISGVPLPFISYGGSSMITSFICIGLLLNISGKRQKTIFVK